MRRRVLYEGRTKQLREDTVLQRNVNVVHYTLKEAALGAATFLSQLDVVLLYFGVFELTQLQRCGTHTLLQLSAGLVFSMQTAMFLVEGGSPLGEHARSSVVFLLFGYGFTPMIRTLTTSISTDSIYALSSLTFGLSLLFHDYGLSGSIVSRPLALNLSLAASTFLISRVDNDFDAFLLLTLAVAAFSYWPRLRNRLVQRHADIPFLLASLLFACACFTTARISLAYLALTVASHILLVGVCPILLIMLQNYKNTIHGPWDIVC